MHLDREKIEKKNTRDDIIVLSVLKCTRFYGWNRTTIFFDSINSNKKVEDG